MSSRLRHWFPFLDWPRPSGALMRGELVAALTVAVVMIPQSVAYAGLAGMPLVTGLYATFLPALLAVLFSRSTRLSVGPSALSSVLVGASLAGLAQPGTEQWVALAAWLALLAGVVQLAVGSAGAAWVLNLVSMPVLTGFSQAAAVLIMASQLAALIGAPGSLREWVQAPLAIQPLALAFGIGSLLIFEAGKRWLPRVPVVLLVLVASAAISAATNYGAHARIVGALPSGLPSFYWPGLPGWEQFGTLAAPALVLALVTSLEMAASARIESQREGRRWDARQDLIGQAMGKFAAAFSGAFPVSTSFSRSAITLYSGARTGWATVLATGVVALVLLFLTPALSYVPSAVLAAVVVAAVIGMIRPGVFMQLWRLHRVEGVIALITFAVTVLAAPRIYWGVLTGMLLGLAHFLYQRTHPRIIEAGLHADGSLRDRHLWKLPPVAPHTYALRMDAALDFASASVLEHQVQEHLARHPDVRHVCLFAQPINRIDATGVEIFGLLRRFLSTRGIVLHVSGLKLPVEQMLQRAGHLIEDERLRLYRTDADALRALQQLAPEPAAPEAPQPGA